MRKPLLTWPKVSSDADAGAKPCVQTAGKGRGKLVEASAIQLIATAKKVNLQVHPDFIGRQLVCTEGCFRESWVNVSRLLLLWSKWEKDLRSGRQVSTRRTEIF